MLAAACVAVGCADSTNDDVFDDADAAADASTDVKKDRTTTDDSGQSTDSSTPKKDSGTLTDSGSDAGPVDAGSDAGKADAGPDAGPTDAGADADASPTDAGADADAGSIPDAGDAGGSVKPLQGEIVISEVMYNPSGAEPLAEWIELHNTTATTLSLSGLVLKDGASPSNSHTIRAGLVIAPGAYIVLVSSATEAMAGKVPAGAIAYDYNTGVLAADRLTLGNSSAGSIVLLDGVTEIARAKYGALGIGNAAAGQSIQLKTLTYAAAGIAASWCKSSNVWIATSDKGTPGAASDCP